MTARRLLSLAGLLFIATPAAASAAPAPDEHRGPVPAKRLERAWPDSEFGGIRQAAGQTGVADVTAMADPLAVVRLIGDKLVRDTPFAYQLSLASPRPLFDGLRWIDFGRSFGADKPGTAYAFTRLTSKEAREFAVQAAHAGACEIRLNGEIVYRRDAGPAVEPKFEERSVELPYSFTLRLRQGSNTLWIKSSTPGGGPWFVGLQPPSLKGAVVAGSAAYPAMGLESVPRVDPAVARLSPWLVLGPFATPAGEGTAAVPDPGRDPVFGKMYQGAAGLVTWTIPKVEVLGTMIAPKPWGTNDTWNYHNGGVAWAMQHLATLTGEASYGKYAADFCDFHLDGAPFVDFQVRTLRASDAANSGFLFLPLLDFTLAPSLPFIHRLRHEQDFANRAGYTAYIARMMKYAREEQVRLPGSNIFTRLTPEKYTTWVDDMFMGIPFLVQAAQYAATPEERRAFLDDAANQALGFNDHVWDVPANLYMHAKYSQRDTKLPHWSRANGWGIWAVTEVLQALPSDHPRRGAILAHYRRHVDALAALQNANGFWLQVLDRPDSREEVSGTAIFTMAIARGIRHGWLERDTYLPIVRKGWDALKTRIQPDGTVRDICYGTMCSEDVNYYLERPFYDNDTHGLFAVLFAGMEVSRLKDR